MSERDANEEHAELQERLDLLRAEREEAERTAASLSTIPGLDAVSGIVKALASEQGDRSGAAPVPRRFSPRALVALAAALLLAALGGWWIVVDGSRPRGGHVLMGDSIVDLTPSGKVDAYGTFRWKCETRPGDWFIVEVFDAGNGDLLERSPELEEDSWTPAASIRDLWPKRIRWLVHLHRASGEHLSEQAHAQRSSP